MSGNAPRLPKSSYKGINGFLDPVLKEPEQPPNTTLPTGSVESNDLTDEGKAKKERELRDAVELHRSAEDMLNIKGSYFPGLEAMEAVADKNDSYESVKAHVKELERRHEEEIAKLYDLQTRDYLLRRLDAYHTADNAMDLPEVDKLLDREFHPGQSPLANMESEYDAYRYLHLRALNGWTKQRNALQEKEESERKTRDAQFPQSISQYNAIPHELQARVARFLLADRAEKERMCNQFGWAYRQVKPLEGDFESSTVFQAQVMKRVREVEARDPRRKTS